MITNYVNKESIRMKVMEQGYITWRDIDALPTVQMSSELCEDAVSREEVIQSITKQYTKHNELVPHWLSIGDLPSVTPKPRTGKWIYHTFGFHKCSLCGSLWSDGITENIFCNYCPRCGAKMEKVSE